LSAAVFRQSEAKIKAPFKSSPTPDAIISGDAISVAGKMRRGKPKNGSYHDALQGGTTVGRVL